MIVNTGSFMRTPPGVFATFQGIEMLAPSRASD